MLVFFKRYYNSHPDTESPQVSSHTSMTIHNTWYDGNCRWNLKSHKSKSLRARLWNQVFRLRLRINICAKVTVDVKFKGYTLVSVVAALALLQVKKWSNWHLHAQYCCCVHKKSQLTLSNPRDVKACQNCSNSRCFVSFHRIPFPQIANA